MGPKYTVGQKVVIHPVSEKGLTQRDSDLTTYAGQIGQVSDLYTISPSAGQIFNMYQVRVGRERKLIVVYEDEMEACLT